LLIDKKTAAKKIHLLFLINKKKTRVEKFKHSLNTIAWTSMNINKQRYQKPNDTVNCGVFVAQYLRILSNGSFDLSIFSNSQTSLKSLRKEMHNVLSQSA
jgi:hypothetical protein